MSYSLGLSLPVPIPLDSPLRDLMRPIPVIRPIPVPLPPGVITDPTEDSGTETGGVYPDMSIPPTQVDGEVDFSIPGVYPNVDVPSEEPMYDEDVTNVDEYTPPNTQPPESLMQMPGEEVFIPDLDPSAPAVEEPAAPVESNGVGGMLTAPVLLIGAAIIGYFFIKK